MNIAIVDIETTGLSRYKHKITEIAGVKVREGKIVEEFSTLVNPQCPIPKFITRLTGITNELVSDAPKIKDAMQSFLDFLGEDTLVAHNAAFDHGFLTHKAMEHLGHEMSPSRICTRKLATRLLPDLPGKKLSDLCEHFNITNSQAHRALADVHATHHAFQHMCDMLEKNEITGIESVLQFECMPVPRAQGKITTL